MCQLKGLWFLVFKPSAVVNMIVCDFVMLPTLQDLEYKKRLLLRCIHHFTADLINNMDHMRISGTEPS